MQPYSSFDLVAALGGLQLLPENASQVVRLEALAHVAASLTPGDAKPCIAEPKLRSLLNASNFSRTFLPLEDPISTPFTESIGFISGSLLILPGLDKEISFVLRNLLKAIFLHRIPLSDREFISRTRAICAAVLSLSDAVASRVGLRRGTASSSHHRGPVTVPSRNALRGLARATIFRDRELDDLFATFTGSPSDLDGLTTPLGEVDVSAYTLEDAALVRRPLVRSGDRIIVAAPSQLASALVAHIVDVAVQRGIGDQLAEKYHDAVWARVCELLRLTRNHPIDSAIIAPPASLLSKHRLFSLDYDKAICAIFLSDSLQGVGAGATNDRWPGHALDSLPETLTAFESQIYSARAHPSGVLFLLVLQHLANTGFRAPVPNVSPRVQRARRNGSRVGDDL